MQQSLWGKGGTTVAIKKKEITHKRLKHKSNPLGLHGKESKKDNMFSIFNSRQGDRGRYDRSPG